MKAKKIIKQLSKEYPGKNIVQLPQGKPTEIICEIEPTADHPERNVAIAVIDKSEPHYHEHARETYEVLRGRLVIKLAHRDVTLGEGQKYLIVPGLVHSAEGNSTMVKVTSEPGWTPEDHILA